MAGALSYRDGFGNTVHLVTAELNQDHAVIAARGTVDVADAAGVVRGAFCPAPDAVFLRQTRLTEPVTISPRPIIALILARLAVT